MLNRFHEIRARRAQGEKGFTLIELLVVVVIIGVLIAIALPLYMNYQKGAKNKSAQADVRNAITAVEQCYSEANNTYPGTGSATNDGSATGSTNIALTCAPGTNQRINVSPGNSVTYSGYDATAKKYTIVGFNSSGDKQYSYDSSTGETTATAH